MMRRNAAYIVALFSGAVILLAFLVPFTQPLSRLLLDWGAVLLAFGVAAGVATLLYHRVRRAAADKTDRLYNSVTAVALVLTAGAGIFGIGSGYFQVQQALQHNPAYMRAVTEAAIAGDDYFKHFPARERLKLVLYPVIAPGYLPAQGELERAGLSLKTYFEIVDTGGNYRKESLHKLFVADDAREIDRIRQVVEKTGKAGATTLAPLIPRIRAWAADQIATLSDDPVNLSVLSQARFKPFILGDEAVDKSAEALLTVLRKQLEAQGGSLSLNRLTELTGTLIAEEPLCAVLAEMLARKLPEPVTGKLARQAAHAFIVFSAAADYRESFADWIFRVVCRPLAGTLYALMAFFIVTAAWRTLRVRSLNSLFLTVAALTVLIGQLPFAALIQLPGVPFSAASAAQWLIDVPVTAAMRALLIGTGLGVVWVSLKILAGIDRGWQGGD